MPEPAISVARLTKRYENVTAVDDVTFDVMAGKVTGFLGPNGAGKTTTIRMILGLVRPTSGGARVEGSSYVGLSAPAQRVGTLIDGADAHPARSGRDHLRVLAAERGVPRERVDEMLETVELTQGGTRRVREFSLGMRQRLGLAAALLADPDILILDEPANGLDPAGIRWLRSFLRDFADGGRTVFVSSHQLAEISQLAHEVVVINQGRFVTHRPVTELTARRAASVRSPKAAQLRDLLAGTAAAITLEGDTLVVEGLSTVEIGEMAARASIVLHELTPRTESLEDVFLALTAQDGNEA